MMVVGSGGDWKLKIDTNFLFKNATNSCFQLVFSLLDYYLSLFGLLAKASCLAYLNAFQLV